MGRSVLCLCKRVTVCVKKHKMNTLRCALRKYCVGTNNKARRSVERAITASSLMGPDDANIFGNVHGGVILQLIEEAGHIITTRYCNTLNSDPSTRSITGLVRVERTDFHQPMHVGEVAECHAEITYTAPHSMETLVQVWAEDILKGSKRLTNEAHLWYVPMCVNDVSKVNPVPPMTYTNGASEEKGRLAYEQQKKERQNRKNQESNYPVCSSNSEVPTTLHTPAHSASTLIHLLSPSEVTLHGFMRGGAIMRLMDECAGITAAKHCQSVTVTASLDTINFHHKVPLGSVVTLNGQVSFTSSRTVEIIVTVDTEMPFGQNGQKQRACEARFTFVALDRNCRPVDVPPLKVSSVSEKELFEEGRKRYEERKALRISKER